MQMQARGGTFLLHDVVVGLLSLTMSCFADADLCLQALRMMTVKAAALAMMTEASTKKVRPFTFPFSNTLHSTLQSQ